MNEFGDVGLDHDLIEEATEETVLMQSGCLCCSIRGDLAKTMASLMARRKRGELAFDRRDRDHRDRGSGADPSYAARR